MKYLLTTSLDFGVTYNITDVGTLEALTKFTKKLNDRRWVILESSSGKPVKWCSYIEELLKADPAGVVATDDPYAAELLKDKGVKTITSRDMFILMGGDVKEYDRLNKIPITAQQMQEAVSEVEDLIDKGIIRVIK